MFSLSTILLNLIGCWFIWGIGLVTGNLHGGLTCCRYKMTFVGLHNSSRQKVGFSHVIIPLVTFSLLLWEKNLPVICFNIFKSLDCSITSIQKWECLLSWMFHAEHPGATSSQIKRWNLTGIPEGPNQPLPVTTPKLSINRLPNTKH